MHTHKLLPLIPFFLAYSFAEPYAEPEPETNPLALEYRDLQPLLARHAAPDRPWATEPSLSQRDETALEYRDLQPLLARHADPDRHWAQPSPNQQPQSPEPALSQRDETALSYRDLQPLLARHADPDRHWAQPQSSEPISQPPTHQRRNVGGTSTSSSSINPVQQAYLLPRIPRDRPRGLLDPERERQHGRPKIADSKLRQMNRGKGVAAWKERGKLGRRAAEAYPGAEAGAGAEAEASGWGSMEDEGLEVVARGLDGMYRSEDLYGRAAVAEGDFGGGDGFGEEIGRRSGKGKDQSQGQGQGGKEGGEWKSIHGKQDKKTAGASGGQGPSDPLLRILWGRNEWTKNDYEHFIARSQLLSKENMVWWNKLDKKWKNGEIKKKGNWEYSGQDNDTGGQGSGA